MERWWVDRRETLVTHSDTGESHYMICMSFFLRLSDMPITQRYPLSADERALAIFMPAWEEKSQGKWTYMHATGMQAHAEVVKRRYSNSFACFSRL